MTAKWSKGAEVLQQGAQNGGNCVVVPQAFNWQPEGVADRAGIPSVTGTLSAGAHPGSYNGQDAFNDLLFPDTPQAYGMYGNSGQEGATVEEQPAITASHGQPGNVAVPAVLMTMREGKPGGGKGPLMVEEESLTLATGNGQTLFQPQAFDEMNFTTDDETHHVLRAGTKQSTGVLEPYGFSAGNSQHARSMGEEQGVAPPIRAGASGTNQSPTVGA